MAKLGISTGSQPNDGTGDSLIDGAAKVNSNFNEIYTTIGDGTTLAVPVTSVSSGTGISVSGSTGNVTITNIGIADTNNLRTDFLEVSGISTLGGAVINGTARIYGSGDYQLDSGNLVLGSGGIQAAGSSQNLNWGSGNFYFNSGSPEIGWTQGSGTLRSVNPSAIISIKGGNPGENLGVFKTGGAAELYYNNVKKLETSGFGVTITGNITCSNIDSTNLDTGTGYLTLGNSSSVFDIRFSPSTGTSPAIRWAVSDGISIMGRYSGGAELREDVRFGTSGQPSYFKNLVPKNDSTYDLGANTNRWAAVYSDEFHGGGANITGISTLNIVNYSGGGGGGGSDTLADVTSRGASTNQTISFSASKGISMDTASNNDFQIYGSSDQKAYITHAQDNGAGGAGDLVVIAKNGLHVYGGTSETTANLGLEVTSGSSNLLYQGNSKLTTTNAGVDVTGTLNVGSTVIVGIGLNLQYQNNTSTILHNSTLGDFNIQSVSGINIKPGPSDFSVYSSDDVLRFKVIPDGGNIYGNLNVGLATNVGAATSNNTVNTPSLTLSHNNPTVAGTSGTTGNIKSIGGAPFYYDGTNWREFVLATGTPVSQPEDSDWDQVILRNDFDTSLTEQRFGQTVYSGSSNTDLVTSPVKVGTKSARIGYPSNGALAYPKRSEYDFTGAWTIEGWWYLDTLPNGTATNAVPLVAHTYLAESTWGLTVEQSGGYLYFRWLNNSSSSHSYNNTSGRGTAVSGGFNTNLLSNAWAHIALVRKASNGSIHLFVNGSETTATSSDQVIDNDIPAFANSYELWFGKCRVGGTTDIYMDGNIDDIRISTSERYTSNFNAPTTALPISGTGSTTYTPPGSLLGEISLGGSPSWTGTTGVTASQVVAGQYRATFATAYSSATDYVIQTSMNDYTPATTAVGIGVSRFTTHADFFVRRVSDGVAIDTGSLAIDLFKK